MLVEPRTGVPEAARDLSRETKHFTLQELDLQSEKVRTAHRFARDAHINQYRFSGEPYTNHLEATADIVLDWLKPQEIDDLVEDMSCAALLHDSVEDAGVSIEDIKEKFGERVALYVEGVTLLRSDKTKEEQDKEDLKFIAQKGYLTPEVFILRLADRLHNMRTLENVPEGKRQKKADETLRVYVKLAESMGMWVVKRELEDLSFPYVYPEVYETIKKEIDEDTRTSVAFTHGMEGFLRWVISSDCVSCNVEARKNGYWALYRKREREAAAGKGPSDNFSNINDVMSFRATTPSRDPIELYSLMGRVVTFPQFRGLVDQDRYHDYVSQPQDNGYSAIQATLNLPNTGAVEIAFASEDMEEFNNDGIVSLLRQRKNLRQYRRNIIFDEKGEAWFLPLNATYVDYVYMTGIGAQASSVTIDGVETALRQKTQNAVNVRVNRYEDLTRATDPELSEHCLGSTKRKIESDINLHARDLLVEKGKSTLEGVLSPRGLLDLSDSPYATRAVIFPMGLPGLNELYFRVGGNYDLLQEVARRLNEAGVTKEGLGLTTIRVSGENKPGILSDLTTMISDRGGDIYQIRLPNPIARPRDTFVIRIVMTGIDLKEKEELKVLLQHDLRFTEVLVV